MQQSSYYGLAGMLPQLYPQAVMAGESVATTVVSISRIVTKASTSSERFGAIAFFVVSIIFIVICVGCQQVIRTSPFVKFHTRQCRQGTEREEGGGEGGEEIVMRTLDGGDHDQELLLAPHKEHSSLYHKFRGELLLQCSHWCDC